MIYSKFNVLWLICQWNIIISELGFPFFRYVSMYMVSTYRPPCFSKPFWWDMINYAWKKLTHSGPGHAKIWLEPYANNKGAEQPAYPGSLTSTFSVRCLDNMICYIQSFEILASFCSWAGRMLPGQKSPKTSFRVMWLSHVPSVP